MQTYVQMVRLEQQRAEAERKREEEARKKRKEQARRISHMLEAGFDGDTNEIKSIMEEVMECSMRHGVVYHNVEITIVYFSSVGYTTAINCTIRRADGSRAIAHLPISLYYCVLSV